MKRDCLRGVWLNPLALLVLGGCAGYNISPPVSSTGLTYLSTDNGYLRSSAATSYWRMAGYYQGQRTPEGCSLASVTMLLNALRVGERRGVPISQEQVLDTVADAKWRAAVSKGGDGLTLDQLGAIVIRALAAYQVSAEVGVVHVSDTDKDKVTWARLMSDMEAQGDVVVLVSFLQGAVTGGTQIGHIAPIGAYDSRRKRLLVMDPDRATYEPYWADSSVLFAGMATVDSSSGKTRGYVFARLHKRRDGQ